LRASRPGYSVVHESVAEKFVAECKKVVVEFYGTDPKSNSDYSRIISPAAVNRLASLIDPKKVVYGGKFDASARYLDPTILYPVSWSDKIMEDEIFGPLLPILTFSDLGKLLEKIKSLPKPLAGASRRKTQAEVSGPCQLPTIKSVCIIPLARNIPISRKLVAESNSVAASLVQ
jgi:acyl-CoA reductase-like NAD-dependent aldehyde dehydrogenase